MPGYVVSSTLMQTLCSMLLCLTNISAVVLYYVVCNKGGKSVGNMEKGKPKSPALSRDVALSQPSLFTPSQKNINKSLS